METGNYKSLLHFKQIYDKKAVPTPQSVPHGEVSTRLREVPSKHRNMPDEEIRRLRFQEEETRRREAEDVRRRLEAAEQQKAIKEEEDDSDDSSWSDMDEGASETESEPEDEDDYISESEEDYSDYEE
jgi:hypothetical protein